jgi:uncharacterized membrane protein YgaE (UPF0421/DUF939 family)
VNVAARSTASARPGRALGDRVRQLWQRIDRAVSWSAPTRAEIWVVGKSAFAAGISWWIARIVTDVRDPVLASLTALVVVQVTVQASVRSAIQRSIAVVLGVLVALAIGDTLELNGITVALLVGVSLGIAQLLMKLPASAARQVPVSVMLVLATVASSQNTYGWRRGLDTVIGAAVGVAVSLVFPASGRASARETVDRLASSLARVLEAMGTGLEEPLSTRQTEEWRRTARTVRNRLVREAAGAVGSSREAARWNIRDRAHTDALRRYEEAIPRLERTAIGVSVISRGLDDHARLAGTTHRAMPAMGSLLVALAAAVRALADDTLGAADDSGLGRALAEVEVRRARCMQGAFRRARVALEHNEGSDADALQVAGEWLGYAALLVQVDRIVGDLRAPS